MKRKSIKLGLCLCSTMFLMCGAWGEDTDSDATSSPLSILKGLEKKYSKVTTIQGSFKQTRVDNTFGETIATNGTFWLSKPDKLRVEYAAPHQSTDLFADGAAYQYVPKLNQVTMLRFRNENTPMDLNFLLLGFGAKAERIQQVYNVKSPKKKAPQGKLGMRFIPKDTKQANFKDFELLVDAETLTPTSFSFIGIDGTSTKAVLNQKDLKIDDPISSKRFIPHWPDKTRVVELE
ncbi:MAG: outer membrane lipoprotein carrier protein LolA [Candidatus Sumerlaeales bacterium]|nr:outer membrane lipoprotein carrier protein LolA [Candidatus Sumerlaeales bacterium]